jgi:hypothetical protein
VSAEGAAEEGAPVIARPCNRCVAPISELLSIAVCAHCGQTFCLHDPRDDECRSCCYCRHGCIGMVTLSPLAYRKHHVAAAAVGDADE